MGRGERRRGEGGEEEGGEGEGEGRFGQKGGGTKRKRNVLHVKNGHLINFKTKQ